ncbi:MAG: MotA/TolQ/ExbB proton channel family protein [Planctomycetota bacterium]
MDSSVLPIGHREETSVTPSERNDIDPAPHLEAALEPDLLDHIDAIDDFDAPESRAVGSNEEPASRGFVGPLALILGGSASGLFYGLIYLASWGPLERYFLGHPVAIAATILFFVASAILVVKLVAVQNQWRKFHALTDGQVAPRQKTDSPSQAFQTQHDAAYVANGWLADLAALSIAQRRSSFVIRLREILTRQTRRGTTKHLADDLRELSTRDADDAHDSFALSRIIVWAIPMLGFLGTVIGITQTLGGLDFSDGNAAVENLKSGLYVAFDTTALGLVLSVLAIFMQFPVEKSEQRLLAAIDRRVGYLTSSYLPGDEAADNQFQLLAQLCEGVRAAVAESLDNQAKLWRQTIDEAQGHWQASNTAQAEGIVAAVEDTLAPALRQHASGMESSSTSNREQLDELFQRWQGQLDTWQSTIVAGAEAMVEQHSNLMHQVDQAERVRGQTESLLTLQQTLTSNLDALDETNRRIDDNLGAAAGQGMADAMIILARAVDRLSGELIDRKPVQQSSDDEPHDNQRRAA